MKSRALHEPHRLDLPWNLTLDRKTINGLKPVVEIIEDRGGLMSIKVSQEMLDLFKRLRWFDSFGNSGRLRVGNILHLRDNARLAPYVGFYKGDHIPEFGSFSFSSSPLDRQISVGAYCSISWDVRIMGGAHPLKNFSTTAGLYSNLEMFKAAYADVGLPMRFFPNSQKPAPIIGNDVWIGQNVILGLGISIGDGAVIAAGSVVVKDVLPYEIVGGVPAKHIRYRFTETERALLQSSRWWEYHLPSLVSGPVDVVTGFIDSLNTAIAHQKVWKLTRFSESLTDLIRANRVAPFLLKTEGKSWNQRRRPIKPRRLNLLDRTCTQPNLSCCLLTGLQGRP